MTPKERGPLRTARGKTSTTAHAKSKSSHGQPGAPIRWSRGANVEDATPEQREADNFDSFRIALEVDRAPKKEGAPYICGPLNLRGRRCKEGVLPTSFIVFDFDHIKPYALPALRKWLSEYMGFGWPTHSSTPDAPRERAILLLSRPVNRAESIAMGAAITSELATKFGDTVVLDDSSFQSEQPAFVPPVKAKLAQYRGSALDVDKYLAAEQPASPATKRDASRDGGLIDNHRNDTLTSLGGTMRRRGMSPGAIEAALIAENAARCIPPLPERNVRKIAASVSKYEPAGDPSDDEIVEAQATVIDELNAKHAVIQVGSDVAILQEFINQDGRPDFSLPKVSAMKLWYANRTVPVAGRKKQELIFDFWLSHPQRRSYDRIVFDPTMKESNRCYNIWCGLAVTPQEGNCSLFLDHIRHVLCGGDAQLYRWVIGWFAHAVQRTGELPGTAIVLRGDEGTGKGTVMQWMGALFGQHFIHLSQSRQLTGNFNAHLKYALMVFADEALWAGDKAARGVLYAMITEKTRQIEPKNIDLYTVSNYMRLVMASNHDWVVPAGPNARRFCVLDVADTHKEEHKYFGAINELMENGGLQALLHYLLHVNLAGINVRKVPRTQALLDQKLQSLDGVARFWVGVLQRGSLRSDGNWPSYVKRSGLYSKYIAAMRDSGERGQRSIETELGHALKKYMPEGFRKGKKIIEGRRELVYYLPPLEECRAVMAAHMQSDVEEMFEDDVDEAPVLRRVK